MCRQQRQGARTYLLRFLFNHDLRALVVLRENTLHATRGKTGAARRGGGGAVRGQVHGLGREHVHSALGGRRVPEGIRLSGGQGRGVAKYSVLESRNRWVSSRERRLDGGIAWSLARRGVWLEVACCPLACLPSQGGKFFEKKIRIT